MTRPRGSLRRDFGRRMRQIRKAAGLTQEQLAKRCGMDYKYIGGVERGERNITIDNLERILDGLKAEAYEVFLFRREAPGKPPDDADALCSLLRRSDPVRRPLLFNLVHAVLSWSPAARS